jgi:Domain of unknown function (DUF397)
MTRSDDVRQDWRTSSTSGGTECVEVRIANHEVQVRDSKNREGVCLAFTHGEWRAFLSGVRLGELDVPTG